MINTNSKSTFHSNFGNQNDNFNDNHLISNQKMKSIETIDERNMSQFSELNSMQNNSSIEMNLNMKSNVQKANPGKNSNKRFLIPK